MWVACVQCWRADYNASSDVAEEAVICPKHLANPAIPDRSSCQYGRAPLTGTRVGDALLNSEACYRSIVAAMSEGVVLQDAAGQIVACNASAERILGLTRDQISGRTSFDPRWEATDAHGAPLRGEDHPTMVTLRTGEPQRDVVMGVHRSDGTRAWIRINTQPLNQP